MNIQDQMLMAYIDKIFDKYDTDKSGTLDQDEMTNFFNQLFQSLGINSKVTAQQSLEAIKSIDQNSDGGVDKKQLFDAFKLMMNKPQYYSPPPQQYNPYTPVQHNPYGQYNPYQQSPQYPPQYQPYNNYPPPPQYGYNPYNSYNPPNQNMTNSNPYMQNNTYSYTQNQRYGMGGSGWGRKN